MQLNYHGKLYLSCLMVMVYAALVSTVSVPSALAADDRPLLTVEEVRSQVSESLSSLVAISLKYRRSQSINPDLPIERKQTGNHDMHPHVWTWRMRGDKRAMFRPSLTDSNPPSRAVHRAFDGTNYYNAYYADDDQSRMTKLQLNDETTQQLLHAFTPDTWFGIRLNWTDETLLSLLKGEEARVVKWENVDGYSALHVDMGTCRMQSGSAMHCEVWFVPDRDWLPVTIILHIDHGSPLGRFPYIQRMFDLERLSDPLLSGERWFPKRVQTKYFSIHDNEVISAEVNQIDTHETFAIEPQIGTEVMKWSLEEPGRPVQISIHGNERQLARLRQETVDRAASLGPPGGQDVVDATPPSGDSVVAVVSWIAGLAFAIWALLIWRRS